MIDFRGRNLHLFCKLLSATSKSVLYVFRNVFFATQKNFKIVTWLAVIWRKRAAAAAAATARKAPMARSWHRSRPPPPPYCKVQIKMQIQIQTRSSWLNCALRDDEAVYWVSIGHYEAVAVGNWWYWVSRGHSCLYILHKVEIWTGVTDASLTHFER